MKPIIKTLKRGFSKSIKNLTWRKLIHGKKDSKTCEPSATDMDCGNGGADRRVILLTTDASNSQSLPENVALPPSDEEDDQINAELFPGFDFQASNADAADKELTEAEEELWQTQQAQRDACYNTFYDEEEADYTAGPVRFIDAYDGLTNVGALLMNFELSQKIQRALRYHRQYLRDNKVAEMQASAKRVFCKKLRRKIRRVKAQIATIEAADGAALPVSESSWLGAVEPMSELQILQKELGKLELLLENTEAGDRAIQAQKGFRADLLISTRAEVDDILEDAFMHAKLLEPPEVRPITPVGDLDIDKEWAILNEKMNDCGQSDDGNNHIISDAQSLGSSPPSLTLQSILRDLSTPEQMERDWMYRAYTRAECQLSQAKEAFEQREETRYQEIVRNRFLYEQSKGREGDSLEAFDLRMLKRDQELTRTLIDCEEAFYTAKRTALEAGVQVIDVEDQTSNFGDKDGAYPLDEEKHRAESVDADWIVYWRSQIPEDGSALSQDEADIAPELDEWEGEEADISDSFSAVGYGRDRLKIQAWRAMCGW